jgi:hypothetical protein
MLILVEGALTGDLYALMFDDEFFSFLKESMVDFLMRITLLV